MTNTEFLDEFNIEYDSVSSNSAPPLDSYEISVFLTQAQDKILDKYAPQFENSEKRRREFSTLLRTATNGSPLSLPSYAIGNQSRFFELESDVRYIVNETVVLYSSETCYNGLTTKVIPVTHDDYNYNIDNPFKKPNKRVSWRLDNRNYTSGNKLVEIITVEGSFASSYKYRYIKIPNPIILETLTGGETIGGLTAATECEMPESIHREILDLAVELALEATGNPRLQTKIGIDQK